MNDPASDPPFRFAPGDRVTFRSARGPVAGVVEAGCRRGWAAGRREFLTYYDVRVDGVLIPCCLESELTARA